MKDLKKVKITEDQEKTYVENKGIKCLNPNCDNNDLHGGSVEIDEDVVFQDITCPECYWTWTDIYKLVGVDKDHIYDEQE